MRLDQLIEQSSTHEATKVLVDRRVTTASRTALTCCAASTAIYNQTRPDDATNLVSWVVDWFGFPTAGFTYTIVVLLIGAVLALATKGFSEANEQTHKIVVGFTIAAAATVIPILLAVLVWVLFVVAIIAVFAATIGFAILVLWALTQIN